MIIQINTIKYALITW